MKIGIIGGGFVGSATALLEGPEVETVIFDIDVDRCRPLGSTLLDAVIDSDLVFIAVNTPMNDNGSCYSS